MIGKIIALILGVLTFSHHNAAHHLDADDKRNLNRFAHDLYSTIIEGRSQENIVYSPADIHFGISLACNAAEGETAEKLRHDLRLGAGDRTQVAKYFADKIPSDLIKRKMLLKLESANRLYISDDLDVTARDYLETETETIKFSEPDLALKKINAWLEQQTA